MTSRPQPLSLRFPLGIEQVKPASTRGDARQPRLDTTNARIGRGAAIVAGIFLSVSSSLVTTVRDWMSCGSEIAESSWATTFE